MAAAPLAAPSPRAATGATSGEFWRDATSWRRFGRHAILLVGVILIAGLAVLYPRRIFGARLAEARALVADGKGAAAIAIYRRLAQNRTADEEVRATISFELANLLLAHHAIAPSDALLDEAMKHYWNVYELLGFHEEALRGLAEIAMARSDLPEGEELTRVMLETIYSRAPENRWARLQLARLAIVDRSWREAASLLAPVVRDPRWGAEARAEQSKIEAALAAAG